MHPDLAASIAELHNSLLAFPKSLNSFAFRAAPKLFRQIVAVYAATEEIEPLTQWATRALEAARNARPDDPVESEDDRVIVVRGDTLYFATTQVSVVEAVTALQDGRPLPELPEWLVPFVYDVYRGASPIAVRDGVVMLEHGLTPVSIIFDLLRDGASISHIRTLLRLTDHVVGQVASYLPRAERKVLFGEKMTLMRQSLKGLEPPSEPIILLRPDGSAMLITDDQLERLNDDMTTRGESGWACLVEVHPWNLCAFGSHLGVEPKAELKQARRLFMLRHPKPHDWLEQETSKCR